MVNKLKSRQRKTETSQPVERGKWTTILAALLILIALRGLFYYVWGRKSASTDYDGVIVDRWADYSESEQGSRARLALVVESSDGKRFTVRVDPNVYESARIGMGIKSKSGQVVLIESKPTGK